ncbi:MAG TPA: rhomboid family intramembrane serine protease [Chloroflexia bacterium]
MIPLGDEGAPMRRGFPIVNITIIVINLAMFFLQMGSDAITYGWSLIPREIMTGVDLVGPQRIPGINETLVLYEAPLGMPYLTLFTSMFMHGGLLHIGSNMLFLFIFGDNVEDNMGSLKYLIFYLLCGLGADFAQIILGGTDSIIPNLGASGAIAGVLGAYLILFPQAQIRALIPLGLFTTITLVPAILMIGFWIVTQFVSVFLAGEQAAGGGGGVAYWAHIGGFIAGAILVFLFRDRSNSDTIFSRFGS